MVAMVTKQDCWLVKISNNHNERTNHPLTFRIDTHNLQLILQSAMFLEFLIGCHGNQNPAN